MKYLRQEQNNPRLTLAHIVLLVLGAAFLVSGAFFPAIWFDESYTVGLMNQNLWDMCVIASYDVHPHLYYILLKLVTMVFGNSIIVMRLFSVAGGILLALLGFTHIRRDFGAKTGFWFSFFTFAMPVMFKYALQIRMYTWAPVFITLTAVYAYRVAYQTGPWKKNWILFALFSVASAYTHHFAVFAVAVINLLLLAYLVKNRCHILRWLLFGAIQIAAYLPGAWVLLRQINEGGADWIKVSYPAVLYNTLDFYFLGGSVENATEIGGNSWIFFTVLAGVIWAFFLVLLILRLKKDPKGAKPAVLALLTALLIIGITLVVSEFRAIYYVRYNMVFYGLIVFFFAYLLAGLEKMLPKLMAAAVFLAVTVSWAIPAYQTNYDSSSWVVEEKLGGAIQDGDVMLLDDSVGAYIAVKFPEVELYYYNQWGWNIDNAFMALGHHVHMTHSTQEITEALESYSGDIWVFMEDSQLNQTVQDLPGVTQEETVSLEMRYYGYDFSVVHYVKE